MKRSNLKLTAISRSVTVLVFCVAILCGWMTACINTEKVSGETLLREWYEQEQDTLLAALHQLDNMVQNKSAVSDMQHQFAVARFRYKRVEGIIEYYFQGLTRRINGPAIPDVKTDDNQVWPPHGFQVLEQYLFSPFHDSLRAALSNEINLLQTDLKFAGANFKETSVLPRHVRELVQHQIIRIGTLGITGMDAPLSKLSVPEAAHALLGLKDLLESYLKEEGTNKMLSRAASEMFQTTVAYANSHAGFDAFNRMEFLRQHLAPLSDLLRNVPAAATKEDMQFSKPFEGTLSDLLQGKGFDPDYYTTYAEAKSNAAKVELGRQLFFDTRLSKTGKLSCGTCHLPEKSFTDGLPKAANIVHGGSLARNTPSLYYAALQRDQFYDHRSTTLEDQVNDVMSSADEFNLEATQAALTLSSSDTYKTLLNKAFGSNKMGGYEVRNALAAYIRTLNPFASRFDAYMRGNNKALSRKEIEGFNLFAGKAKCATCHFIPLFNGTVPPWFTKSESEIIGVPAAPLWKDAKVDTDPGRYKWNQLEALRYAFKTPTVRNSAATAPYMHNGVYKTLDEVVRFYHIGGGVGIGMELPFQTLPFDSLQLNKGEEESLVAFLHSLTDEVH